MRNTPAYEGLTSVPAWVAYASYASSDPKPEGCSRKQNLLHSFSRLPQVRLLSGAVVILIFVWFLQRRRLKQRRRRGSDPGGLRV